MPIYGGFGIRQQEAGYNKVLYNIAYLLQRRQRVEQGLIR